MRVLVAALVAVLSITASVALAASSTPDGAVSSFQVSDSRHTYPMSLDGLAVAIRTEVDRRTFLVAAMEAEKARRDAEAAALREAQQRATQPVSRGSVNWDGIARCETGGNWQHQTRYDGGLGILHAAWIEFGGREFAEYGSQATREQQIVVAERIHARYGLSGWGCRAYG